MLKKKEIGGIIPNLKKTVAYYSPATFSITLNSVTEQQHIQLMEANEINSSNVNHVCILYHEIQHHLDHTSTLWGIKNILSHANAIAAKLGRDETQFHRIIKYKLQERQLHYAKYYTEEYNLIPWTKNQKNWGYTITSGLKFDHDGNLDDDYPIVFVRFNTSSGDSLVRVPISIASLLETNAINAEVRIKSAFLTKLSENERLVENALNNMDMMSNVIYNPKLALYTVAVHLTANLLGLSDTADAFPISSAVATIALNLPSECLALIPIPEDHKAWGKRPKNLISNQDYGYIFLVLLSNYRKFFVSDQREYSIDRLLLANNLPSVSQVEKMVIDQMTECRNELIGLENLRGNFLNIIDQGIIQFQLRGISGDNVFSAELMTTGNYKPWIIFDDTDFDTEYSSLKYVLTNLPIANLTNQEWYNFAETMNSNMDDFFEVRGL